MPKGTPLAPEAKCVSFAELFAEGRDFKIPDYQRAYAWEAGEVKDLLEDIDRLALMREEDEDVSHVMGMITCHRSSDIRKPYRIVDGQQRLTTLALIHAELSRRANSESFIFSKNGNVRLIPQALDENFFYATLRGKSGVFQTQGQRNYAAAAKVIRHWVENNSRTPEVLKSLVEDGLSLILFTLRNEADVARVFEAINNRGRKVTQLDLVKNHLMGHCPDTAYREQEGRKMGTRFMIDALTIGALVGGLILARERAAESFATIRDVAVSVASRTQPVALDRATGTLGIRG